MTHDPQLISSSPSPSQVTDSAGANGWSSTAKSFNEVLKLLNESYGKPKKDKKDKKSKIPILTAGMK